MTAAFVKEKASGDGKAMAEDMENTARRGEYKDPPEAPRRAGKTRGIRETEIARLIEQERVNNEPSTFQVASSIHPSFEIGRHAAASEETILHEIVPTHDNA
ncbi:hypothetical protein MTO96_005535 [Rhipicephalus appendiculatus]